ncbi:MmpS family transport accessory protein [Mycobacterium sp. 852002-51057_SCH5723018]|uniref:MmpS family transport accessory protein n=1 Tax=Mycobacterium sp. 852002-51057_SCH5723018 TaxID=1834094 RepID=UPI0009EED1B3|nr:MmpS family transport accessory protein [Mycobacterium sp. 852002-51057_SCH5723018]
MIPITHVLKRGWIPLVLVVVPAVCGLAVDRLHGIVGSGDPDSMRQDGRDFPNAKSISAGRPR